MAKIYDALKRAEEERQRNSQGPAAQGVAASPAAPATWSDEPIRPPVRRSFKFWNRAASEPKVDAADEVNRRRITVLQPDSFVSEQFRVLRSRIDSIAAQRPIKTVSMASANPGEGKSTAAVNLAVVTSLSVGRQVLLIDCDLRRPKIARSFGIEPQTGLAEVLLGTDSLENAVIKADGLNLDLLCVHKQPVNPSELLASAQMRNLIEEACSRYDRVILDTPATLGLPDAKTVTELTDGLVMVVRADKTPRDDVSAALEILDRRRVLGLVLNGARDSREHYRYY